MSFAVCPCPCHHAPDAGRPPCGVVPLLYPIETYAACDACRGEHWRAYYEATEPAARAPTPKPPWVDPPPAEADGWQNE